MLVWLTRKGNIDIVKISLNDEYALNASCAHMVVIVFFAMRYFM